MPTFSGWLSSASEELAVIIDVFPSILVFVLTRIEVLVGLQGDAFDIMFRVRYGAETSAPSLPWDDPTVFEDALIPTGIRRVPR